VAAGRSDVERVSRRRHPPALARGGLDKQASILPLIGQMRMTIVSLDLAPEAATTVVGRRPQEMAPLSISLPKRDAGGCWFAAPR